jgi:hypothetical protein
MSGKRAINFFHRPSGLRLLCQPYGMKSRGIKGHRLRRPFQHPGADSPGNIDIADSEPVTFIPKPFVQVVQGRFLLHRVDDADGLRRHFKYLGVVVSAARLSGVAKLLLMLLTPSTRVSLSCQTIWP